MEAGKLGNDHELAGEQVQHKVMCWPHTLYTVGGPEPDMPITLDCIVGSCL